MKKLKNTSQACKCGHAKSDHNFIHKECCFLFCDCSNFRWKRIHGKTREICEDCAIERDENVERLLAILKEVDEWRGLDGDGISDPLLSTIKSELRGEGEQ